MKSSLAEHYGLFEAIRDGDGVLAAERVLAHFEAGKHYLLTS